MLFFIFLIPSAFSSPKIDKQDLESFLINLDRDPKTYMNVLPPKKDVAGFNKQKNKAEDEIEAFNNRNFIIYKDDVRKKFYKKVKNQNGEIQLVFLEGTLPGKAPYLEGDLAEDVVDLPKNKMVRSLSSMEKLNLKEAELTGNQVPWSDDYWPIYRGILGARYAVENPFGSPYRFQDWSFYLDNISKNPMDEILKRENSDEMDLLSPSEKYDLLTGAQDETSKKPNDPLQQVFGSLTRSMWQQPLHYANEEGKVETWMGICHGWAPASYMLPRPTRMVTLESPQGQKIRFYPSDIKALGSLLWAEVRTPTKFIGGRCDDKDPPKDTNGRVISQNCFDTNPGTWHLAVVNQVGKAKRSLVMDATYDYEVWNQPIVSYSYTYFNPQTLKHTDNLQNAIVSFKSFTKDKFKKYRKDREGKLFQLLRKMGLLPAGASTQLIDKIVGISMAVTYIVETEPTHAETDSPELDGRKTVEYHYDLELDKKGNIIGGEWYTNLHPDFLWTPEQTESPNSSGDAQLLGLWSGKDKLPTLWQNIAQRVSKNRQPLAKIVRALFDRASSKE